MSPVILKLVDRFQNLGKSILQKASESCPNLVRTSCPSGVFAQGCHAIMNDEIKLSLDIFSSLSTCGWNDQSLRSFPDQNNCLRFVLLSFFKLQNCYGRWNSLMTTSLNIVVLSFSSVKSWSLLWFWIQFCRTYSAQILVVTFHDRFCSKCRMFWFERLGTIKSSIEESGKFTHNLSFMKLADLRIFGNVCIYDIVSPGRVYVSSGRIASDFRNNGSSLQSPPQEPQRPWGF